MMYPLSLMGRSATTGQSSPPSGISLASPFSAGQSFAGADSLLFGARPKPQIQLFSTVTDPQTGQTLSLNHTSCMFRQPEVFGMLPGLLEKTFPKGAPIEIYAGSHGEDALSTALALLDAFGPQKALQYPVYVSDLVPKNLYRARQGIIGQPADEVSADGSVQVDAWTFMEACWKSAAEQSGGRITGALNRYINPVPLGEDQFRPFLIRNSGKTREAGMNSIWHGRFQHEKLYRLTPEARSVLDKTIHYRRKPVNAVEALSHRRRGGKPRIVFLRNMMYLVPPEQRRQLLADLKNNLPQGSVLMLGISEYKGEYPDHGFASQSFLQQVRDAGFRLMPGSEGCVWQKAPAAK